jgi:U1 small nuclear ribonucleoprotein
MTDKLPPSLLTLFTPRPPLKWLAPTDHAAEDRHTQPITGLAGYMHLLKEYKETDVYHPTESHQQKKDRLKKEKRDLQKYLLTDGIKDCKSPRSGAMEGLEGGPVGGIEGLICLYYFYLHRR